MPAVLVTGAASGIGRATAKRFETEGWDVYATDVDTDGLDTLTGCRTIPMDVTDPTAVDRVVDRIRTEAGGLDCLVANAGFLQAGPLEELPADALARQFEVNVGGTMRVIRAALPLLRWRGGTVIAVSSTHAHVTTPGMGAYAGSKHALDGLLDTLRMETATQSVEVVMVEPAWVSTALSEQSQQELKELDGSQRYRDVYDTLAAGTLLGGGSLAVSPQRVAATIYDAAIANAPKARYSVGLPAKAVLATRWLPQSIQDLGQRVTMRLLASIHRVRDRAGEWTGLFQTGDAE
ncbi:MAG: SDR family oxidoreductase [Halorhabdus sp.]